MPGQFGLVRALVEIEAQRSREGLLLDVPTPGVGITQAAFDSSAEGAPRAGAS